MNAKSDLEGRHLSSVPAPAGVVAGEQDPRLRRTRRLTDAFAVFTAFGVVAAGLGSSGFALWPAGLAVAVAGLVTWWVLRPQTTSWWLIAAEATIILAACLVLAAPEPVVGLLFGVTTRRAVRAQLNRSLVPAAPAFVAYVAGLLTSLVVHGASANVANAAYLGPRLLPLVGLVVATLALRDTVTAVNTAWAAQEQTATLLRTSPIGLIVVDDTGAVRIVNDYGRRLFGWGTAPTSALRIPCPHSQDARQCAQGCVRPPWQERVAEWTVTRADGRELTLVVHVAPFTGGSGGLLAICDISERKVLEDRLRDRAERDQLTGVASRGHFLELLDASVATDEAVAVLVIDLDDFKDINDAYGHLAGDNVLTTAAVRIGRALPPSDLLGRLGGDEFAVITHAPRDAERLGGRIQAELAAPRTNGRWDVPTRGSIGVAVAEPGSYASAANLLRDADTAMYAAKRAGGNQVRLFHQAMRAQYLASQEQERQLHQALDNNEMLLHYQPIVDLRTGAVVGAEALMRWLHPQQGFVPPNLFIALAERTDLICVLGEWAMTEACRQAVSWAAAGMPIKMSVNVSARQLHLPGFIDSLDDTLAGTGIAPAGLTLELTESALAKDSALTTLNAVRERGVSVALDDFGTGYSSLSYLQRQPFDVIKVDRSFIGRLGHSSTADGIVRCVLQLAEALNTPVVAEGVETQAQSDFLAAAGCAFAQGYYFSKPTPANEWPPAINATTPAASPASPPTR